MDKIHLTGIRGYGYMGALAEEQVLGQWFEVDLTLWLDLAIAGENDRLEDTFDYRAAIAIVQHLVKTSRFALLERLAMAIANSILYPENSYLSVSVQQVQVSVSKLAAPIPDFSGKITVEIIRPKD